MFSMRRNRLGAASWLLAVLGLVALLVGSFRQGVHFETDILTLLPKSEQRPSVQTAFSSVAEAWSQRIVFLVGQTNVANAQAATTFYANHLAGFDWLEQVEWKVDTEEKERAFFEWVFPCRENLLSEADMELLEQHPQDFLERSEQWLHTPFASGFGHILEEDPLLLFPQFVKSLPALPGAMQVIDGFMMAEQEGVHYALIRAKMRGSAFSRKKQKLLHYYLLGVEELLKVQFPGAVMLKTGMPFFAHHGAERAEGEARLISTGSMIGILAIILLAFRSFRLMPIMVLPILVGLLASFAICFRIFPSVHVITLGFGASMIGISVDYCFHYYAEAFAGAGAANRDNESVLSRILPGITLGMITSVLAYGGMLFTPFPGLRQMAVFSGVGLIAAYSTVVCWFPLFMKQAALTARPGLFRFPGWLLGQFSKVPSKVVYGLLALLGIVSCWGISKVEFDDDIRLLQPPAHKLLKNEAAVRGLIGDVIGAGEFFVVEGATSQGVLENEEALFKQLHSLSNQQAEASILGVSRLLPSLARQRQSRAVLTSMLLGADRRLEKYMEHLGFSPEAFESARARFDDEIVLELNDFLENPAFADLHALWIGAVDGGQASIVLAQGVGTAAERKQLAERYDEYHYVNKVEEVSGTLQRLRKQALWMLAFSYLGIALFLFIRYGAKRFWRVFIPPVLAGGIAMGILGLSGTPIHIFHCFGLLLVLGMGIDYTIFFAEAPAQNRSVMLAILMSAMTTLLAFGLLAFSTTPAMSGFGLVICWGMSWALLLSPLAAGGVTEE